MKSYIFGERAAMEELNRNSELTQESSKPPDISRTRDVIICRAVFISIVDDEFGNMFLVDEILTSEARYGCLFLEIFDDTSDGWLGVKDADLISHSNLILYDKERKEVYCFEPFGESNYNENINWESFIPEDYKQITGLRSKGPQYGGDKCMFWCMFLCSHVLKMRGESLADIIRNFCPES